MVGYVQRKLKTKYPNYEISEGSSEGWLKVLSRGNLINPNERLVSLCEYLESEFAKFHGLGISRSYDPMKELLNDVTAKLSCNTKELTYVIQLFLKIRFFNRLKWLNEQHQLKESTEKIRRLKQRAQHMY